MKSTELLTHLAAFLALNFSSARADTTNSSHLPSEEFKWISGPTTVSLRDVARLRIPEGFVFLNATQSRKLLEGLGNSTSGNEVGLIASESQDWSVVVEFHPVGYVSEAGWELLDKSAILTAIRASDQRANLGRERRGQPTMEVQDWESAPTYNPDTHTMEWAVRAISDGAAVINRVISVLSRRGVLQFILVDLRPSPASASGLRRLVQGLAFEPGERYVDHQPGDPATAGGLRGLLATLETPARFEPSHESSLTGPRRLEQTGDHWWLVSIAAGFAGFLAGQRWRRHRRGHRNSRVPVTQRTPAHRSTTRPVASVQAAPLLNRGGEATAAGAASPIPGSPPESSDSSRFRRRRRCDAYSFYARLTRDLHWTINY